MSLFGWVADRVELPPQWDLRGAGWTLARGLFQRGEVFLIDMRARRPGILLAKLAGMADPDRCVALGIDCGEERARLLEAGCADALPRTTGLRELDLRARRIAAARESFPRRREAGPLTLDLFHRDARSGRDWLALHPREFELLWRLAERPGERVSRVQLLREVWRLDFVPGTNSIEVHISRLRAKLAAAGAGGLIETDPRGGYRLVRPRDPAQARCAEPRDLWLCA